MKKHHRKLLCTMQLMVLILLMPVVHAAQLDPRWAEDRDGANKLGDRANNRDGQALLELRQLADGDNAPAMHNLGWLYGNAHNSLTAPDESQWPEKILKVDTLSKSFKELQDEPHRRRCDWFQKGAEGEYPPSLLGHARFCVLPESSAATSGVQWMNMKI